MAEPTHPFMSQDDPPKPLACEEAQKCNEAWQLSARLEDAVVLHAVVLHCSELMVSLKLSS